MSWIAKAVLAAAWLNCGLANVWAQTPDLSKQQSGSWLKDGERAYPPAWQYQDRYPLPPPRGWYRRDDW